MFESILIANRGEIAVRIMRTAKKMGLSTVAVYSEADTNALHVKYADDAFYLGPPPSTQSYLNQEKLIEAINQSGADAVHPGYGFLSENEGFCKAVAGAGATFVGPPVKAIRLMGDKIESKKVAKEAGVNTVPGTEEAISDYDEARVVARDIGYPVMIKAAAGGGGKGMRVAWNEKELKQGMRLAASEAESSFNDARIFIEKFFEEPRHIEIQVLADNHGNVITLGERECSIQRRHQKVIEEAPSPFLNDKMRTKMSEQSVALAKKVGYSSAGTVEYIVDKKGNFYFLEMNTRLQVEHRVTELITGIDLVEQMIRVAAGEELQLTQDKVVFHGWAMESRVYAEDPSRGFLPSTGRIVRYQEPKIQAKTLIDTGVYEGGEVSMYYDPMIAKVCTHATNRQKTIEAMQEALAAYTIEGVSHNISFLEAICAHKRFQKGDMSTNFIEQEYPGGFSGAELTTESAKVCLATAVYLFMRDMERALQTTGQLPGRTPQLGTRWVVVLEDQNFAVSVRKRANGYDVAYDDGMVSIRSDWKLGRRLFQGVVDGKKVSVKIEPLAEGYRLSHAGSEIKAAVRTPRVSELARYMPETVEEDLSHQIRSPIAGLVSRMLVSEGDSVTEGQELFVIEAMKMENIVYADHDAEIAKINVTAPQSVNADAVVLEFNTD